MWNLSVHGERHPGGETHIFGSLHVFIKWELMRSKKIISNWYEIQRNLFTLVVREHILASLSSDVIVENT